MRNTLETDYLYPGSPFITSLPYSIGGFFVGFLQVFCRPVDATANREIMNDELLLIDMDTLSIGSPIFELAQIRAAYVCYEEDEPGNFLSFFGLNAEFCKKLYEDIIYKYLGNLKEDNLDKIAILSYLHLLWWNGVNESDNLVRLNGCKGRLLKLLSKYDDLDIGL